MSKLVEKKYDNSTIVTIKNMYAKGATDDEFKVFITLSQKYDLDPMLNELYFIKYGGSKPIMMTSRDGYLKIANRDPNFDGMDGEVVYEGDIIQKKEDGRIAITYGENHLKFDNSKITGAFCNVYRKDRTKCSSVLVSFKDYNKNSGIWKTNPNAMILKVAESMALKRAFAINGLVTREEMDENIQNINPQQQPQKKNTAFDVEAETGEFISEDELNVLCDLLKECNNSSDIYAHLLQEFQISSLGELYKSEYEKIIKDLKKKRE